MWPTEELFVYVYVADKGFNGAAFAAAQAARSTTVFVLPGKKQRAAMPSALLKVIAEWRNRIETTFSDITVQMELARHRQLRNHRTTSNYPQTPATAQLRPGHRRRSRASSS